MPLNHTGRSPSAALMYSLYFFIPIRQNCESNLPFGEVPAGDGELDKTTQRDKDPE